MVSDHSSVNQLTVGRVHAHRAIEVENTDCVGGIPSKSTKRSPVVSRRKKERKKDVGTQLTHIRQPRTAQAAIACGGLTQYLLSLTTSEVSA